MTLTALQEIDDSPTKVPYVVEKHKKYASLIFKFSFTIWFPLFLQE